MEALAEHAEFVRALAMALVRDPNEADDLVQETWLAAAGREWGSRRGLRGRLQGLVRGLASNRRRSEARRKRRERESARPEAATHDDDLVERLELRQQVVQAILELDEIYRIVLLMRFEQDLSPTEIAHHLQLPLETVRTRLRRALQRVRERLDGVYGERQAWAPSLLIFAHPPNPGLALATTSILMKKALLVSCAALVLALGSWSVIAALKIDAPQQAVAEVGPAQVVESEVAVNEVEPKALVQPAEARTELAVPLPGQAAALDFRIVSEQDSSPLAGATVYFASEDVLAQELRKTHNGDLEQQLHDVGQRYTADAEGVVRLPGSQHGGWVCARLGSLWGGRRVQEDEPAPRVVELMEDRALFVNVMDQDGLRMAGVPLTLLGSTPVESTSIFGTANGESRSLWRGKSTDSDTEPTIRHLGHVLSKWPGRPSADWILRAEIPTWPQPEVELDLSAPELQPVELVLAPVGGLEVHLAMPGGVGDQPAGRYWLNTTERVTGRKPQRNTSSSVSGVFKSGTFTIPNVGLNQLYELSITGWDKTLKTSLDGSATFEGPSEDEPLTRVEIDLALKGLRCTGRLLDADGEPVTEGSARFTIKPLEDSSHSQNIRFFSTGSDGEFDFSWSISLPETDWKLVLLVEGGDGRWHEGEFQFDSPNGALGDLRLQSAPLLAAGHVIDEDGAAVAGAKVGIAFGPIKLDGEPGEKTNMGWITYYRTPLRMFGGTTDEDGAFRIFGSPQRDELSLAATGDEVMPAELVAFEPGAEGLEVLAVHPGTLHGRVIPPRGVKPKELRILLKESLKISRLRWGLRTSSRNLPRDSSGRFRITSIPFETVTLQVFLGSIAEPLIEIPGLSVKHGEASSDPQLDPLDLSKLCHSFELRAFDADSKPIKSAQLELRPSAQPSQALARRRLRNGRVRAILPWSQVDVVISAKGYRKLSLKAVEGYREVVLEAE